MSFTIGEPVPGRPPKPDPYRPLAALLESLEIGGSLTVPLAVPIADDRVKVGNAAISSLRRYAEEQGVGILNPVCALTDEGLSLSFTKMMRWAADLPEDPKLRRRLKGGGATAGR